jgi:transposase InsO family protein
MSKHTLDFGTTQERWARFRFSVIGSLLAAPPDAGELQVALADLAEKKWRHPITGLPDKFGASTIERWLYQARNERDPVNALQTKRRTDAGKPRQFHLQLKQALQQQYRDHPSWSCQLHVDNLAVRVKTSTELGPMPSYSTVRRYMKSNNLIKQHRVRKRNTEGAEIAAERLETREVRSFEMDHVNALWHLDFHHGSHLILRRDGKWHKPLMLAIIDDRSRLICHAQWYLDETAETLVHGFMQALQKRALPRALMSDNGAAMISAEFKQGLARLGILHQPTLPYSPYQNAKIETFWSQIEGRLLAMLEGETELTLSQLNQATIPWIELEYHRKVHSEMGCTPLERYLNDPDVSRPCPDTATLRHAFCDQVKRKQRKSDGTFSLEGMRFEVPSQYRHLAELHVRYARWDLGHVSLVDPHNSNAILCRLYLQDKSDNATGFRRAFEPAQDIPISDAQTKSDTAPLLKELLSEYAATGLPMPYKPKGEEL